MGEFGDKFRKAREKKEISLDDVSNVTKIGARMLRAIEEENFDQLPGGVFNKGFIRAYAKHLGMDPEEAVTDYLACLRQAQIDAHEVWEPEAASKPGSRQPGSSQSGSTQPGSAQRFAPPERLRVIEPNKSAVKTQSSVDVEELSDLQLPRDQHARAPRNDFAGHSGGEIPWRILAVAAIVVALSAILWIRHSHRTHTAAASLSPAKLQQGIAASSAPTSAPELLKQPANPAPAGAATSAHPSAAHPHPSQVAQSSTASAHSTTAAPTTSPFVNSGNGAEGNAGAPRTLNKSVLPPTAKSAAPLSLVIRATETSWISVQADGQTVSQETLIAPAHASIRADHEIVARIGNAAGVTFLWNGQEIPAEGAEAEVKTFVFDANGVRVVPSTQSPVQGR